MTRVTTIRYSDGTEEDIITFGDGSQEVRRGGAVRYSSPGEGQSHEDLVNRMTPSDAEVVDDRSVRDPDSEPYVEPIEPDVEPEPEPDLEPDWNEPPGIRTDP
jgi:hypothetical protein